MLFLWCVGWIVCVAMVCVFFLCGCVVLVCVVVCGGGGREIKKEKEKKCGAKEPKVELNRQKHKK